MLESLMAILARGVATTTSSTPASALRCVASDSVAITFCLGACLMEDI